MSFASYSSCVPQELNLPNNEGDFVRLYSLPHQPEWMAPVLLIIGFSMVAATVFLDIHDRKKQMASETGAKQERNSRK